MSGSHAGAGREEWRMKGSLDDFLGVPVGAIIVYRGNQIFDEGQVRTWGIRTRVEKRRRSPRAVSFSRVNQPVHRSLDDGRAISVTGDE